MRHIHIVALVVGLAAAGSAFAQDQTRDRLQDCGSLGQEECADLLRIQDRLRDCDGASSDECADLLRDRDRLLDQARDQDRDPDQDQDQTRDRDRDG